MLSDCCSDYTIECVPPVFCEDMCQEVIHDPATGLNCFCDLSCTIYSDCCVDYTEFCGDFCAPNGDVNSDSDVNVLDVVNVIVIIISGQDQTDDCTFSSADVNEDDGVAVLDAIEILISIFSG